MLMSVAFMRFDGEVVILVFVFGEHDPFAAQELEAPANAGLSCCSIVGDTVLRYLNEGWI